MWIWHRRYGGRVRCNDRLRRHLLHENATVSSVLAVAREVRALQPP